MSNALPAKDQSMDEILASIRRIIETGDKRTSSSSTSGRRAAAPSPRSATDRPGDAEASGTVTDFPAPQQGSPREEAVASAPPPRAAAPQGERAPGADMAGAARTDTVAGREGPDVASKVMARQPLEARIYEAEARDLDSFYDLDEAGLADATAAMHASPAEATAPHAGDAVNRVSANAPRSIRRPAPVAPEPLPQWPEAVAANDRASDFGAEMFVDEFDEESFANALLNDVEKEDVAPVADQHPNWSDDVEMMSTEEGGVGETGRLEEPSDLQALAAAGDSLQFAHALISQEAGERVAASFSDLASAIRDEHLRDVDGVVREVLRPMLQEWLDENLPRMVEHMVREEISRIARGNRA